MKTYPIKITLLVSLLAILFWSAMRPYDYFTWLLEVVPVLVAVPILVATHRRFQFTTLIYALIWVHAVILIIGGHYTYARMPLFDWVRDTLNMSRNHYDRLGHFAQGFIPAMIAREVLVRTSPLKSGRWLPFVVVCICLSISAFYELIEWAVALATGTAATDFLGTQGDAWDTQTDMFLALLGSICALVLLGRTHDRALKAIAPSS